MNDKNNIKTTKSSSNGSEALSDVLHMLKLDVDIYHNAKVCGNWRIDEHKLGATCFHIVTLGRCIMHVTDADPVILNEGDLVIFPREITHHMLPLDTLTGQQQHLSFTDAKEFSGTGLLCGEALFHHKGCGVLLDQFPPFFVIKNTVHNHWLKSILEMVVSENTYHPPASQSMINRLSELLFAYAIRQYIKDFPKASGMLEIYSDIQLAKAINGIHQAPHHHWTLHNLSREAGLSRTLFAERFKSVSGWTPGQYLVWWRMQLAWTLLDNGESVSRVAEKVGYKSESSFSRAFSKMFSTSAGKVKRKKQARDG